MTWRRVVAIARKEVRHITRDPRSLAMAIAIPMLLLLLFGYALTLDVDRVPLAVWDQSGTPASRELVSRFSASRYFDVIATVGDYAALEALTDRGDALAALVVPRDFDRRLGRPGGAAVQLLIDGSDSNTATIAMGYADSVVQGYSQEVAVGLTSRQGRVPPRRALDVRPRVWYNADLESRNYIVPGLIAVIMMVIAALLTSLTVAREWERGSMEQLISTPMTGPELVIGKLLPYFAVGMLDVALAVLVGEVLFDVPLRGSLFLLAASSAVFLAGALAIGMLISIVTRGQLLASQLAMVLTFLPSFLLSGFMYAVDNMPPVIRVITYLVPARHFVDVLKGIYLKGSGLESLAGELALLAGFGAVMLTLAVVRFRKVLA
ncbi:MAG: ABC transporter permease [Vicinamibacteraceae bacterium]|nr:ABC transporter permease [Vicinamibacteraceae bacterium]